MSNEYIVERRIKQNKLQRKARRNEIAIRRIYKIIRFFIILFIFYCLFKYADSHFWYLNPNTYNDKTGKYIEILGNSIVSNDRILAEMKKFPILKVPIYKINPAAMAHQIEQLTPVKRAYVRRYWYPARYVVMIEEIIPAITISPSENTPDVAAFALTGEYIGREYLPLKNKSNTIKVLSYGTNGDDYEKWDVEKITTLYNLAKLLEQYAGEKVKYIDLRIPHNAFIQLDSVKIKLGEIDISAFERIKSIHDILPATKDLKENTKYIDLSWTDSKYIKVSDEE